MRRRVLERILVVAGILLLVVGVGVVGYAWWSERQYQLTRPAGPPPEDLPERFDVPAGSPPATQPGTGPHRDEGSSPVLTGAATGEQHRHHSRLRALAVI